MGRVFLKDVVIRCPSDQRNDILDGARLSLTFVGEGGVKRTEYLAREPAGRFWRLGEDIEVSTSVPSSRLIIMMEHPGQDDQQLGFVELVGANLLMQYTEENHGFVQSFNNTSNGLPFELVSFCVVLPDIPSDRYIILEDDNDEDAFRERCLIASLFGQTMGADDLKHLALRVKLERTLALSDDNEEKPVCLHHVGDIAYLVYSKSSKNAYLDQAIVAYTAAAKLLPGGHQHKAEFHTHLGIALFQKYEYSGNVSDINNAISAFECTLRLTPDGHADKPARLSSLGTSLRSRFQHSGEPIDVNEAISFHEQAASLTPNGHAAKPGRLSNLGTSLMYCFQYSRDVIHVNQAISAFEQAVYLTPNGHTDKPGHLNNFGKAIICHFQISGDLIDVNKAIFAHEQAVHLTSDGHADKHGYLTNLGNSLANRLKCSGNLVDADKAISIHEQAVHLTPDGHADKAGHLSNLGSSFLDRFEHSGNMSDVDKAITIHEQAVHLTPDGHTEKPGRLSNLGNSLRCRFDRSGDLVDVDRAITAHEQGVHLTPNGHAKQPACLNNFGNSLLRRFEHSGDLIDVNKAISAHEQAVHLTPDGHVMKSGCLNNLGASFMYHFKHSRNFDDVSKAISTLEKAVHFTPDGHARKPCYLSSLAVSLQYQFEHCGDFTNIDKAISTHEQAVHLTPDDHPMKPCYLSNLGNSLLCRFDCSENPISIFAYGQAAAVQPTPDCHADKLTCTSHLDTVSKCNCKSCKDLIDINRAISTHEQALNLTPDGHTDKPFYMHNLGNSFLQRFRHSRDDVDCDVAISHFRCAATYFTGSPRIRFIAAMRWARLASSIHNLPALEGYTVALNLLPRVAWLGKSITERHKELSTAGDMVNEAAATAISAGHYDTALEWLEQGRSIVWGQLLNLRTPVDALHAVEPSLAGELMHVSRALEHANIQGAGNFNVSTRSDQQLSLEQAVQHHRRLAEEWEKLVKKAQGVPGFKDFLQPKRVAQLRSAAKAGPVVVVNVHKRRCDALILQAGLDKVVHIPLVNFSFEKAQRLHQSLNQLLVTAGVRVRDTRHVKIATTTKGGGFRAILSILWSCVVKPVLDGLAFSVSHESDPPRIWWCPTGPLAFLPIHAAGVYNENKPGFNISDYVVSSYTPTLSAIIKATESRETQQKFRGLLAVSQSNTPGQSPLPNTTVELKQIKERVPKSDFHQLEGPAALVKSVIEGMEANSWVHLACHAVQNTKAPTKSALCLYDGHLELSTIITKSFPHADFAFLSACQTATGDENLSEEAVHLAAAMMLAGYRGVIATMWSVQDKDAPVIADEVYSKLFSGTEPDSAKAALALHRAVKCLRQQVGDLDFMSWVPFIHVGM